MGTLRPLDYRVRFEELQEEYRELQEAYDQLERESAMYREFWEFVEARQKELELEWVR